MNNRIIKFRVWSKTKNRWLNSVVIGDNGSPLIVYIEINDKQEVINKVFSLDGFDPVIQQFTGLQDKNGRDIFEGDILCEKMTAEMAAEGTESSIGSIIFNGGSFMLDDGEELYDHIYSHSPDILEDYLVIGNIFDNPELLK